MSKLLEVKNLQKFFNEGEGKVLKVISSVSFSLDAGESLAIMGQSGAGKSVLLNIISSLEPQSSGSCLFNGQEVNAASELAQANYRNNEIGYVFQFHNLLIDFTAVENVMIPAIIAGKSYADAKAAALGCLESMNIGQKADSKVLKLSGGEQQRVAIARALIQKPSLILADEPTGSLDLKTGEEVLAVLLNIVKVNKMALLMVTHNHDIAVKLNKKMELKGGVLN